MIAAIDRPQMSGSLPPVVPVPRLSPERSFLGKVDDAWFVIPVRCRRAWQTHLAAPATHHVTPHYARRIPNPFAITFTDVKDNS
jgi:hypothetical protein